MVHHIAESGITFLITVLLTSPFLKGRKSWILLPAAGIYYSLYETILRFDYAPLGVNLNHLTFNWDGKFAGALFSGVVLLLLQRRGFPKTLQLLPKRRDWQRTAVLTGIALIPMVVSTIIIWETTGFDWENFLFNATLPGIDEELSYRGVLLLTVAKALRSSFGSNTPGNPAVLFTALLFGLAHGFELNAQWEISFSLPYFVLTTFLGYIMGMIVTETRSILPAILAHNIWNTTGIFLRIFLGIIDT